jgi:hypothetical protein
VSDLEARYRRALAWYPREWRAKNADAVVGTLLDEAEASGRPRPRLGDLLDLAVSGVRTRFARMPFVTSGARDRLATLAFGIGAALMTIMLVGTEFTPWAPDALRESVGSFGPFRSAAVIINMMWVVAFVLTLANRRSWSRVILMLTVPASIAAILFINQSPGLYWRPPATVLTFVMVLAILAASGRPVRLQAATSAGLFAAAFAIVTVVVYASNSWPLGLRLDEGWAVAANGFWPVLFFAAAAVVAFAGRGRWSVALMVLAVTWIFFSASTDYTRHTNVEVIVWSIAGLLCGVAVTGALVMRARGYRIQIVKRP